jgi:hypothetical protein
LIGSFCIPGIIFLIVGAYYPKYKVKNTFALAEIILSVVASIGWYIVKINFIHDKILIQIEPMICGMAAALIVHLLGMKKDRGVVL